MHIDIGNDSNLARGGIVMLVVGVALAGFGTYDYWQQSDAISNSATVEATITETDVKQVSGRRGDVEFRPVVHFDYRYEGESYTARNVFPATFSPNYERKSKANSVVREYDDGETVTAYVPPDSPGSAFLEREVTRDPLKFVVIGALSALVGAASVVRRFL